MYRVVILAVLATACGRIGFDTDPGATSDGGGSDGAPNDPCALPGLALFLRFDETAGVAAQDSSASGNDGTLVGFGASGTWGAGRVGGALGFAGSQAVTIGSPASLDDLAALTVCAWIRPDDFTPFSTIVDKSVDGYVDGWNFYLRRNVGFGLYTRSRHYREGGSYTLGVWQHACGTWDGQPNVAGVLLYRDGALITGTNTGGQGGSLQTDAAQDLVIGRQGGTQFAFQGVMDDVRIYARALSATEIATLHTCSTSGS